VAIRGTRLFSGHVNHQIRSRDSATLEILETYSGHEDGVHSIAFDENFILFSCSYDGVIKKWNMASRTVAFSFEDRNSSITTLALHKSLLLVGTLVGDIRCFNLNDTTLFGTIDLHRGAVSSIAIQDDIVFSSGMDGKLLMFAGNEIMNVRVLCDSASPLQSLTLAFNSMITLTRGTEVIIWPQDGNFTSQNTIYASEPLTTLTVTKALIISGSKSGTIFAWDLRTYNLAFVLNKHTFQVNHLIAYNDMLFSASEDMTIMQWSLPGRQFVRAFQRTSNFNLGHLGPVNSLAICGGALFSGGSDLVTRRWNIETGKHQDLLVGHFKSVTSVLCYNNSVLTGSEDSAVFLFRPDLKDVEIVSLGTFTKSNVRQRQRKTVIRSSFLSTESLMQNRQSIIYITVSVAILISCCVALFLFSRKKRSGDKSSPAVFAYKTDSSQTVTDLETIINSVMGISKHAAYLIDSSYIAKIKKLAAGGGGEIYLAKTMDAALRAKLGDIVVQKIIFARSKPFEEAFYQEVGIMIMLSTFPNFCKILGYTENPLSMILAYYPDGSLNEWLRKNHLSLRTTVKILREISSALNTMHSHYLAHCDIKSQNVLVQIERDIPSCYLTDFGITQVLSEKIIATKSFHVINLRGLSVHYASPEAFENFRSKKFGRADFKKYDIYSLSCIMFEVLTKRSPWN
jgi:WD40 repeat protein